MAAGTRPAWRVAGHRRSVARLGHDARMTSVVRPLPGPGLVARSGELVLVCADTPGAGELLGLLGEVSAAGGDGPALVRRVAARLAGEDAYRLPDCALTGPAPNGSVAVLVHGAGVAEVAGAGGPVRLAGADAITSQNRLVPGPVELVVLTVRGAGPAGSLPATVDDRLRLDAGVVTGAGAVIGAGLPVGTGSRPRVPPMAAPTSAAAPVPPPAAVPASVDPPHRPTILGLYCQHEHFNDPADRFCRVCGESLAERAKGPAEGPRPPLGVLLLDDGNAYPLDLDYVLGREPHNDPQVASGAARGLRIADPAGVVSRRHARIALVGWDVQVIDLGSANGTFVQIPGEAERRQLSAGHPLVIRPGTEVILGRRFLRYEIRSNP
jgi:FHA domain-containing protein